MKILHTSDWHLGRALYQRKRYQEFAAFLDWLVETIADRQIDVLLVSGDIFDTSMPSNRAQKLYYQFLNKAAQKGCQHIVITGGNHDSPTFLNAPKILLESLNIHVIGSVTEDLQDEVLVLNNKDNEPALIICAVPYLRDKDIRSVELGESLEDKSQNLTLAIKQHYDQVYAIAKHQQDDLNREIPIIAMGHLFATGGKTSINDGVRELYVGSLARVTEETFSSGFDYVALGHLHITQQVGKANHIRYSGSPIAMGFGEAGQQKMVIEVEVIDGKLTINEIMIPCFQSLIQIRGTYPEIVTKLEELKAQNSDAWLEIDYTGDEIISDLQERLNQIIIDSSLVICRVFNHQLANRVLLQINENETLQDLDEMEVFIRCLDSHNVPDEQRLALIQSYQETIETIHQDDPLAE